MSNIENARRLAEMSHADFIKQFLAQLPPAPPPSSHCPFCFERIRRTGYCHLCERPITQAERDQVAERLLAEWLKETPK